MAAATDNVGLFFGEDIFFAIASILLIQGVFESAGYRSRRCSLSVWAIPTAICAFVIHGARFCRSTAGCGRQARNDHLEVVLCGRGRRVRRFCAAERCAIASALGQCRVLGAAGGEFLGGSMYLGDSATGCWCWRWWRLPGSAGSSAAIRATTTPRSGTRLRRLGNRLFLPALIVPLTRSRARCFTNACLATGLFESRRETLILFGIGVVLALAAAMLWLRPPLLAPLEEGRRLARFDRLGGDPAADAGERSAPCSRWPGWARSSAGWRAQSSPKAACC